MKNRILIYGYHGMRNTGADARLLVIRDAVRAMLPDVEIIVPTVHRTNLSFVTGVRLHYMHPATYPWAVKSLLREVDAMILSEGNMLTDEFSKHLMLAFVTAIRQAKSLGVPTIGLALDSGKLEPEHEPLVRDALDSLSLLTARAQGARDSLVRMGVKTPITLTADCAVSLGLPEEQEKEALLARLGLAGRKVHGIAPVDFFMWPAKISLFGAKDDYVRWPFKATWPNEGRARSQALLDELTGFANELLARDPEAHIALVAMEAVDERFCSRIRSGIADPSRVIDVHCTKLTPVEMAVALGGLTSLVTSRYHALVLSMLSAVPYIAVGHDTRTSFISRELGVEKFFVKYDTPNLANALLPLHAELLERRADVSSRIASGLGKLRARDRINYDLLADVFRMLGYAPRKFDGSAPLAQERLSSGAVG